MLSHSHGSYLTCFLIKRLNERLTRLPGDLLKTASVTDNSQELY